MFRINYGMNMLSPELIKSTAIKWYKGLGKYRQYAKIERKNEEGNWINVKLVEKNKD